MNILEYHGASGNAQPVETSAEWQLRRQDILHNMQKVMGTLPDFSATPLDVEILQREELPGFSRLRITYRAEPGDRVPAYLLIPREWSTPAPGVLCLHQTTPHGKAEPAGVAGISDLHYAAHLAQRGYVTLAPDYPLHRPLSKTHDYRTDPYELGYASATMKGVHNHRRALDVLQSLGEVDASRIGCIGHSLGGHNTIILGAFDERVKAMVSNSGVNSFRVYRGGDLKDWSHKGYMPLIETLYNCRAENMPFDFPEVIAALAPRPLLVIAPQRDDDVEVEGVPECIAAGQKVYDLLGVGGKLAVSYPDCAHEFPPESRKLAYGWLDRWLRHFPLGAKTVV